MLKNTFPTEDKDFTLDAFTYLGTVSDDFDDEGTMTVVHTGKHLLVNQNGYYHQKRPNACDTI